MEKQQQMPYEKGLDHSLKLLREGYSFIINRKQAFDSNVFETKLLGEKVICLTGSEAAELFYDTEKFKREGAAPEPVKKVLFGDGGVQALDGEAHRHRKAMFMDVMSQEQLARVRDLTEKYWDAAAAAWENRDEIVLYDEINRIFTQTACEWTGIPLGDDEVDTRAGQLQELFESSAEVSMSHLKARRDRSELEDWVKQYIRDVRNETRDVPEHTPLYKFSHHLDHNNEKLDEQTVAVELLNLIRPLVAISVYVVFTALALHEYPNEKEKLHTREEKRLEWFIQEVRRFYPFFPFTAARVNKSFSWNGYEFEEETLTLLDLYGTNHHPGDWNHPETFAPDRFADWDESPFNFIPQGGGEFDLGHRCAGEWVTIDLMKVSLDYIAHKLNYTLPEQDLSYSLAEIPALPASGIRMKNVKRKDTVN
ncbi:cytochrome P450 [Salisediminibacterium halotolerans]|uniref:Fatty-acid peroxygenase n=1 Tax=Salisediminibacterium halotolerans TaxID=517425 RepID=A0A1H9ULM4_9BACI|nr:cytochrome P450 [Salisediminibacterium haloalkalitolerans]SES10249.1 fatty-acid peroxygenase [Salisediminibacterium haloalkalitolerans]